jgi:hypothetical protein
MNFKAGGKWEDGKAEQGLKKEDGKEADDAGQEMDVKEKAEVYTSLKRARKR